MTKMSILSTLLALALGVAACGGGGGKGPTGPGYKVKAAATMPR
jgi:hypothetical protein